ADVAERQRAGELDLGVADLDRADVVEARLDEEIEEGGDRDRGEKPQCRSATARRSGPTKGTCATRRSPAPTGCAWSRAAPSISSRSVPKSMPAWCAILGSRLVAVMPGIVFTSSRYSLPRSDTMRSTRVAPEQPSARCAASAWVSTPRYRSGPSRAG